MKARGLSPLPAGHHQLYPAVSLLALFSHLITLFGAAAQDGLQRITLGQLGQEALNGNALLPEIEVSDQFVALLSAVPAETDITTLALRTAKICCHRLTAITTHRLLTGTGLLTQITQCGQQGFPIAEFSFDRAEVRHGCSALRRYWRWPGNAQPSARVS